MSRFDILKVEALDRYVYLDGVEIAHCSDRVAADLIAIGLERLGLTDARIPILIAQKARVSS